MNILCPTDFSDHATHALKYAVNLANDLDAQIHIVSIFDTTYTASSFISIEQNVRTIYEEDMSKMLSGITPLIKTDKIPETKIIKGKTVPTILNYIKKHQIDLVVMGTKGSSSIKNLLFGGITRKVAERSPIPILAIPKNFSYTTLKNRILLALDNKILAHESTFEIPLLIARKYKLKIDIIHIEKEEESIPFDPFISQYLGDTIGEVFLERGSDPVTHVKQYADQNQVMMLMMVRRSKGFLSKLLTVGNTSEEIARTQIPLMILPD